MLPGVAVGATVHAACRPKGLLKNAWISVQGVHPRATTFKAAGCAALHSPAAPSSCYGLKE